MRATAQHGMSIIEVMVAITLAALLLALGAPSFVTGMQNRQIRTAADAIQNGLMQARTEALRRNRNVSFQLTSAQASWTVGCETPDTTIINGEPACPAVVQTRDASEGTTKAQVDKSEIVQSSGASAGTTAFTNTGTLTFTPLGRVTTSGTSPTLGAGNYAIYSVSNPTTGTCVSAGGEMRCLAVRVTAGGQIRMCDPAVSTASGDPRAC